MKQGDKLGFKEVYKGEQQEDTQLNLRQHLAFVQDEQ